MAFLQDPINQPDLGGEAGSSKHLQQHSRHCSKQTCRHAKCFSKIVLPAPGPAVGEHHNCTETQLCKNTKNRTRHLEDASHQLQKYFAPTAFKGELNFSIFISNPLFSISPHSNQPKPYLRPHQQGPNYQAFPLAQNRAAPRTATSCRPS